MALFGFGPGQHFSSPHKSPWRILVASAAGIFYVQLVHSDGEGAHGHVAAREGLVGEVDGGPAPVADVPGHGARVVRVVVVGAHLAVDADNVQDAHGKAEEEARDGGPDAHDEGDELGDQDEQGDDGDGDVVVGQAGGLLSVPMCVWLAGSFLFSRASGGGGGGRGLIDALTALTRQRGGRAGTGGWPWRRRRCWGSS